MEKLKNTVLLITLLLLILGNFVSAATVTFIDAAYVKNGTLSISGPDGTALKTLEPSESIELQNNTAYMLDYTANGFQKVDGEVNNFFAFPTLQFLISFFTNPVNLLVLLVLILALIMIAVSL